jgi:hypothetical protein
MLPWDAATILASSPVPSVASLFALPDGPWIGTDIQENHAVGVIQGELRFLGSWDDIRGKTLDFNILPTSLDLGGQPIITKSLPVSVHQIGPPRKEHKMPDTSTVATWGGVAAYTEGDCATLGCVIVQGYCGNFAGMAGQVLTKGASKVVVSMRLESDGTYINEPSSLSSIRLLTPLGQSLTSDKEGQWEFDHVEQVWTYDTEGHDVIGFAIESSSYCHGWGGPIIVESIRAE